MNKLLSRLFVLLQHVLPKHVLTAAIYRLARVRTRWVKNLLIRRFVQLFKVDIAEARDPVPDGYATFNEFFTRQLEDGARPIDEQAQTVVSPVDGTLSMAGPLQQATIIQAKQLDYTLQDLLASDIDTAFIDGSYATIYLAPYNYHRVHAPFAGELLAANYVPGDLFSVNAATVENVTGLFRRNERLVLQFKTAFGIAALIFVGALNVGSISTPWTGEIRPRKKGLLEALPLPHPKPQLQKGDLLGWFNMGSTVILLLPKGAGGWRDALQPGATLRMGTAIADIGAERQ